MGRGGPTRIDRTRMAQSEVAEYLLLVFIIFLNNEIIRMVN